MIMIILRLMEISRIVYAHWNNQINTPDSDASCAVTSASINVSRICLKDQKEIIYISIASLDDNGSETPSYFSFNCEDGAGEFSVTLPKISGKFM